jgi:transcriptional regulator with PAS, ATPase and Fis domain
VLCRYEWPGGVREPENVVVTPWFPRREAAWASTPCHPTSSCARWPESDDDGYGGRETTEGIVPFDQLEAQAIRCALKHIRVPNRRGRGNDV